MRVWLAAVAVLCLNAAPAGAYIEDFLPGAFKSATRAVPQHKLFEIEADQKKQIDGVEFANQPDGFSVSGKSAGGKSWSVKFDQVGLGGTVFKADLDGNGQQDFAAIVGTAACGIAPPSRLMMLLFDKDRVPHAYEIIGYFNAGPQDKAIEDIVTMGKNSGSVLINQELTWHSTKEKDRHYWRWSLYRLKDAHMVPLSGAFAGSVFPTYVWYTDKPNHKISRLTAILEKKNKDADGIPPVPVEIR